MDPDLFPFYKRVVSVAASMIQVAISSIEDQEAQSKALHELSVRIEQCCEDTLAMYAGADRDTLRKLFPQGSSVGDLKWEPLEGEENWLGD